jgi:hypothetical protein
MDKFEFQKGGAAVKQLRYSHNQSALAELHKDMRLDANDSYAAGGVANFTTRKNASIEKALNKSLALNFNQ